MRLTLPALPLALGGAVSLGLASQGCGIDYSVDSHETIPVAQAYVVVPGGAEDGSDALERYARIAFGPSVQLDGSLSFRDTPSGQSTEGLVYTWQIHLTPEGSAIALDDPAAPKPSFTPDVAGTYEFQLVVALDTNEEVTSPPSIATVIAAPPEDLTVRLEWTTGGTDVDLHLLSPGGTYWTDGDCYFGNPVPDWGISGSAVDNPVLNRDDDDGGDEANPGVEEAVIQRPEDGDFEVVVTYYNDRNSGLGVSPTLVVSVGGVEIGAMGPVDLTDEGQAWRALRIRWPEMQVEPIDERTTHEALGGPAYNTGS